MIRSKPRTCLVLGEEIARYGFGQGHPFGPDRHDAFVRELKGEQLLDEAGWTVGADGIRERDGKKLMLRSFDLFEPRWGEVFQANMFRWCQRATRFRRSCAAPCWPARRARAAS